MKEKNSAEVTSKRKRLIYSLILAVCVLLLVTATALTVYFVTTGGQEVLEKPSIEDPTGGDKKDPDTNKPTGPDEEKKDPDENKPTGGGEVVRFTSPVANATCSVEYASIYTNATLKGQIRKHMGVDYTVAAGTDVVSIAAGTVVSISLEPTLGNLISVDHGDGLVSYYRFVEPVESLKEGDKVEKGQVIATVAQAYGTEQHAGEHLHFEMKLNKDWVDPASYFDITYAEK